MQDATPIADGGALPAGTPPLWPRAIRALHWITALLLIVGVVAVLLREQVESHGLRTQLMGLHRQAGLLILLLAIVRIGVRLRTDAPRWLQSAPAKFAALATHLATYLLMLGLPVMGWLLTNAKGKPVSLLGLPLPTLLDRDRDLAESIESWHALAGWTLLVLVGLHILAALWHHVFAKDDVLRAMLGRTRPASTPPASSIPPASSL